MRPQEGQDREHVADPNVKVAREHPDPEDDRDRDREEVAATATAHQGEPRAHQ
jgi:hypothetical protein